MDIEEARARDYIEAPCLDFDPTHDAPPDSYPVETDYVDDDTARIDAAHGYDPMNPSGVSDDFRERWGG